MSSPSSPSSPARSILGKSDFVPLAPLVIAPYLEPYGYAAIDDKTWRVRPGTLAATHAAVPRMELRVAGHEEVDGRTMYTIACSLIDMSVRTDWVTKRRLVQLREDLHDSVKAELGDDYQSHFANAPFAHKGGVPGTTARLDTWFSTLADCISRGQAPPVVVALVLYFLEAPEPEKCSDLVRQLDAMSMVGGRTGPPMILKLASSTVANSREGGSNLLEEIELSLDWDASLTKKQGLSGMLREGLVLRFRLPNASERLVDFGTRQPPLGVDFRKTIPLQVSRSYIFAETLGVQPGWELVSINGTNVETWKPADAFHFMKAILLGLPKNSTKDTPGSQEMESGMVNTPPSLMEGRISMIKEDSTPKYQDLPAHCTQQESRLVLGFLLPNGSQATVAFAESNLPLGLAFKRRMPITVKMVNADSPAQAKGIQEGWVVVSVNGKDISGHTDFIGVYAMLQDALANKRKECGIGGARCHQADTTRT